MARDPATYFARSRALYRAIVEPDMDALSRRGDLTVGVFVDAFISANPRIPAAAIRVTTAPGGWLDEAWLCLDKRFRYERCRSNQDGGVSLRRSLKIWRGS